MRQTTDLQAYLHRHIPLSADMQVRVVSADETVELAAPLTPNINHRSTVFGGSLSALALLAGWSLVHLRLADRPCRLVIQENTIAYLRPARGDFTARCLPPDEAAWSRFLTTLDRRGRARITLVVEITSDGETVARFEGRYVALGIDE